MQEQKRERQPVKIDSRYFVETVLAARTAIRTLRENLDELEKRCNNICDRAVPEFLAEANAVTPGAEKSTNRPSGEVPSLHPEENTV